MTLAVDERATDCRDPVYLLKRCASAYPEFRWTLEWRSYGLVIVGSILELRYEAPGLVQPSWLDGTSTDSDQVLICTSIARLLHNVRNNPK